MTEKCGLFRIVRLVVNKIRVAKWVPAAILGAGAFMGCEAEQGGRTLNEDKLQEIKVGSVVKLSDLIHEKAYAVCVLHPYQDKIADRYSESVSVNKYLGNIKYQAGESYWALVTLTSGSAKHYEFKRSKDLDIFAAHGLKSFATVDLPANFEMAECASFDQAALFKTSIGDRIYLIFGSIK